MEKPYKYEKVRFEDSYILMRLNNMVRDFLRSDADILLKMDIDQVYPKDYLTVMVPLAEQYRLAGPLIYSKRLKYSYPPLLYDDALAPQRDRSTNWSDLIPEDGILKLNYAHTNLFYCREVLENIKPPWYDVEYSQDNCSLIKKADFCFMEKIIRQGFKTYINTNMVVGHLVEEALTPDIFKRWAKIRCASI